MFKILTKLVSVCVFTITSLALLASNPTHIHTTESFSKAPQKENILFRENKGQWNSDIHYKLELAAVQIYAEKGRLTWAVHNQNDIERIAELTHSGPETQRSGLDDKSREIILRSHGFRMNFLNANQNHGTQAFRPSKTYSNYFIGNDKTKWASKVQDFEEISYTDLYEGIDLHIMEDQGYLKYEFHLDAYADPEQIQVEYEGVRELNLVGGNLYVVTSVNEIKELRPYAFQVINGKEIKVPCEFNVNGNILTYHLPEGYDKTLPLIIDPTLIFASYSGSTADNWGMTATPGPNGELYGAGVVFGNGYPTIGAYDSSYNTNSGFFTLRSDIGITKFSADGTQILYSTYLGGNKSDIPHSLVVNNKGELIVMGSSSSTNFPTSNNAYNNSHSGGDRSRTINGISVEGTDILVSVFSEDGTSLRGSTLIGGSADDGLMYDATDLVINYSDQLRGEVNIDRQDNIYVASVSRSDDFPVLKGFQQENKGGFDAVIFSLSPAVDSLRWSSYFGGTNNDAAYSIKVDNENNILVSGGTVNRALFDNYSPLQSDYGGEIDGYILKIASDGSQIINGTYIGTPAYDQVYFTDVDDENNVYIYGQSEGDMPVTPDVYSNDGGGMFIQKLSTDLDEILFATRIGSGNNVANLSPAAFLVDDCRRIFISGWGGIITSGYYSKSTTNGLPITDDALQKTTDGHDFYFMVLEKEASELIYATFFGGDSGNSSNAREHVDGGTSRFSKEGEIYQAVCAGCRNPDIFPTTDGAVATTHNSGNCNLGVIKIAFELNDIIAKADIGADSIGCAPQTVKFKNLSKGTNTFLWEFDDGDTSTVFEPEHTYTYPGTYLVTLIAIPDNPCLKPDTAHYQIIVNESPEPTITNLRSCQDTTFTLSSSITDPDATYVWSTGEVNNSIEVNESGSYYVISEFQNCSVLDSFEVDIIVPDTRIESDIECQSASMDLIIDEKADNILWNTGDTSATIRITEPGEYIVSYDIKFCSFSDTAHITFPDPVEVTILSDSSACDGDTITLFAQNLENSSIDDYSWSTGEKGEHINITETGTYAVTVTTDEGCHDTDSVHVTFIPQLPELNLPDTIIQLCSDDIYPVDLSAYANEWTEFSWSDGIDQPERVFTQSGTYTIHISNICQELRGDLEISKTSYSGSNLPVYIPNAFTPNEDGINDGFHPFFHPDVQIKEYVFEVFNRWGDKVFGSTEPNSSWTGYFKGKLLDPDVYMWTLEIEYSLCKETYKKTKKGNVSILK